MTSDDPFASVHRSAGLRRGLAVGGAVAGLAVVVGAILLVTTVPGQGLVAERLQPVEAGAEDPFGVPTEAPDATAAATSPSAGPTPTPDNSVPSPISTRYSFSTNAPTVPLAAPAAPSILPEKISLQWGRIYVDNSTVDYSGERYTYPQIGQCLSRGTLWSYSTGLPYFIARCNPGDLRVRSTTDFIDNGRVSVAEAERTLDALAEVAWRTCFAAFATDLGGEFTAWYDDDSNLMHWDYVTADEVWLVEPAPGRLICMELV